nr:Mariner Mos1 transposase [Hymenolepis microstoma]
MEENQEQRMPRVQGKWYFNASFQKMAHDNARPPHVAKLAVKKYLETLKREILPHPPPYSPDVAPSADFHPTHLAQWHTAWLTSTSGLKKK